MNTVGPYTGLAPSARGERTRKAVHARVPSPAGSEHVSETVKEILVPPPPSQTHMGWRVLTAVPIVRRSAIQRYGMGRDLGLEWCVNRRRQLYHDQPVEQTRPPTATDTCRHASDFPMKWTYAHLAELQRKDPAIGVVYE